MATYIDSTTEVAVITSSISGTVITTRETDVGTITDKLLTKVTTAITEVAVITSSAPNTVMSITTEVATITSSSTEVQHPVNATREVAVILDKLSTKVTTSVTETATIHGTTSQVLPWSSITDVAIITSDKLPGESVVSKTTETAVITDSFAAGVIDKTTEVAAITSSGTDSLVSCAGVTEVGVITSSATAVAHLLNATTDAAKIVSASTHSLVAIDVTRDVAVILDRILEPPAGDAWAAGTDLFNMSRYTNYAFNSLAVVDGKLVALAEDGAYLLDAADDAGAKIKAVTVGDITDNIDGQQGPVGDPRVRRPGFLYLSYMATGTVKFVLGETGDGQETRHEFDLPPRAALAMIGGRVQLDAGIESRFFRCGFEAECNFAINDGRVSFAMLQRRA